MVHCCQLTHQQQCMSKGEAEGEIPPTTWVTGLRQCTHLCGSEGDKSKNPFFDVRVYTRDAFYREIYATMCACAIKWASKYMAEYVGPSFWDGMYERDEKGERAANVGVHYLTRVFARLRGMHGAGMLEHDRIVLTVLL